MRNLKTPQLWNGTLLKVTSLNKHLIEATILSGCGKEATVFTPRISIIAQETLVSGECLLCSDNQKVSRAGFTYSRHRLKNWTTVQLDADRQLDAACSRVSKSSDLFICSDGSTKKFVYKEALQSTKNVCNCILVCVDKCISLTCVFNILCM